MKTYDIKRFINHESEFFTLLKNLPALNEDGPWIAGGSVWKSIENIPLTCDLDFFFKSKEQCLEWYKTLFSLPYVHRMVSDPKFNHFNTSFKYHVHYRGYNKTVTVQLVTFKFFKDIQELLDGFDFTACQFGFDGNTLFTGDTSLEDLRNREIIFNNIHDSVATGVHVDKYTAIGFKVPDSQQEKYKEINKKTSEWKANKFPTPEVNSILSRWGSVSSSSPTIAASMPRVSIDEDTDDYAYPRPSSGGLDLSQFNHTAAAPMPRIEDPSQVFYTSRIISPGVSTVEVDMTVPAIPMDYVTSESSPTTEAAPVQENVNGYGYVGGSSAPEHSPTYRGEYNRHLPAELQRLD